MASTTMATLILNPQSTTITIPTQFEYMLLQSKFICYGTKQQLHISHDLNIQNANQSSSSSQQMNNIQFNEPIAMISSNEHIIHILTQNGTIYAYGDDHNNQGLLGLSKDIHTTSIPKAIASTKRFNHITTGSLIAAAIDDLGRIYTWGGGTTHQPQPLALPEISNSKYVHSSNHILAIITIGGKLYFYNTANSELQTVMHFQNHKINSYFKKLTLFHFGGGAALTENGDVYLINNQVKAIKLQLPNSITNILSNSSLLVLLSDKQQIFIYNIISLKSQMFFDNTPIFNKMHLKHTLQLEPNQLISYPRANLLQSSQIISISTQTQSDQHTTLEKSFTKENISKLKSQLFESWEPQIAVTRPPLSKTIVQPEILYTLDEENSDDHSLSWGSLEDVKQIYNSKRKQLQIKDIIHSTTAEPQSNTNKLTTIKSQLNTIFAKSNNKNQQQQYQLLHNHHQDDKNPNSSINTNIDKHQKNKCLEKIVKQETDLTNEMVPEVLETTTNYSNYSPNYPNQMHNTICQLSNNQQHQLTEQINDDRDKIVKIKEQVKEMNDDTECKVVKKNEELSSNNNTTTNDNINSNHSQNEQSFTRENTQKRKTFLKQSSPNGVVSKQEKPIQFKIEVDQPTIPLQQKNTINLDDLFCKPESTVDRSVIIKQRLNKLMNLSTKQDEDCFTSNEHSRIVSLDSNQSYASCQQELNNFNQIFPIDQRQIEQSFKKKPQSNFDFMPLLMEEKQMKENVPQTVQQSAVSLNNCDLTIQKNLTDNNLSEQQNINADKESPNQNQQLAINKINNESPFPIRRELANKTNCLNQSPIKVQSAKSPLQVLDQSSKNNIDQSPIKLNTPNSIKQSIINKSEQLQNNQSPQIVASVFPVSQNIYQINAIIESSSNKINQSPIQAQQSTHHTPQISTKVQNLNLPRQNQSPIKVYQQKSLKQSPSPQSTPMASPIQIRNQLLESPIVNTQPTSPFNLVSNISYESIEKNNSPRSQIKPFLFTAEEESCVDQKLKTTFLLDKKDLSIIHEECELLICQEDILEVDRRATIGKPPLSSIQLNQSAVFHSQVSFSAKKEKENVNNSIVMKTEQTVCHSSNPQLESILSRYRSFSLNPEQPIIVGRKNEPVKVCGQKAITVNPLGRKKTAKVVNDLPLRKLFFRLDIHVKLTKLEAFFNLKQQLKKPKNKFY